MLYMGLGLTPFLQFEQYLCPLLLVSITVSRRLFVLLVGGEQGFQKREGLIFYDGGVQIGQSDSE